MIFYLRSIGQVEGHLLKNQEFLSRIYLVMKYDQKLKLTQRLLVNCKYVMTLSFGHMCKFQVTIRKTMHPLLSNKEIFELPGICSQQGVSFVNLIDLKVNSLTTQYPSELFVKCHTILQTAPTGFAQYLLLHRIAIGYFVQ